MGKKPLIERIKDWFVEEMNWEAVMERLFQWDTLIGLIGAATSFGILNWTEVKAKSFAYACVTIFGLYMAGRNKKKAIKKAAEEMLVTPVPDEVI